MHRRVELSILKNRPEKLRKYDLCRPKIQTGDVIEFRSPTLIGGLIRMITKKTVNHTAKVIRFDRYDPDRVYLLEALGHGVVLNLLSRRLTEFKGLVWWLPLKSDFNEARCLIGRHALKCTGLPYDYPSICRQMFKRVSTDADRFFCSEFAYFADVSAGLPVVKMDHVPYPGEMIDTGVYNQPIKIL